MKIFRKDKDTKKIEQAIKFRQGLGRVRSYADKLKLGQDKLWSLGRRASELGDTQQLKSISAQYARNQELIARWERYLVKAETSAVRRDHAQLTKDFLDSMSSIGTYMTPDATPKDILEMERNTEKALSEAQAIDEGLSVMMQAAGDSLLEPGDLSGASPAELEKALSQDFTYQHGDLDKELEELELLRRGMQT